MGGSLEVVTKQRSEAVTLAVSWLGTLPSTSPSYAPVVFHPFPLAPSSSISYIPTSGVLVAPRATRLSQGSRAPYCSVSDAQGHRWLLRCSARRERVACLGCLTRGLPHSYAICSTCWWGDRGWGNPSVLTASPLSFSGPPPLLA